MGISNTQVAHLWANRSRASAKGSNFFFGGPILYSYGSHFPVGAFVATDPGWQGPPVVLLNSGTYSVSTSKHQSYAFSAINGHGFRLFRVPRLPQTARESTEALAIVGNTAHADNLVYFAKRHADTIEKIGKARGSKNHTADERRAIFAAEADAIADDWRAYCEAFGLPAPEVDTLTGNPEYADLVEAAKHATAEKARREAERRKAEEAANAQGLADWREGKGPLPGAYRHADPARLRVVAALPQWGSKAHKRAPYIEVDTVQTTGGAAVEASEVRPLLSRILAARASGDLAEFAGVRVGDFTISGGTAHALRIGCHRIEWEEVEYLARRLGVEIPEPATV